MSDLMNYNKINNILDELWVKKMIKLINTPNGKSIFPVLKNCYILGYIYI